MVPFQQNDDDNFKKHASKGPPSSPDLSDIVRVPKLGPRVGPEYQIEVPSVIKKAKRRYRRDIDGTANATEHKKAVKVRKNGLSDNVEELKPTTFQSVMTGDSKTGQLVRVKHNLIAPGRLSDPWSDADIKSFVLGLFIFGKNFIQVKRFLENKGMGDILSFYYGKFYKSDEYCRWSECRKIKGRKCVIGQKLFTGQRQHELLSRLIPLVSEGSQDTLRQVSKSFVEGRTSLEEYIHSLKSTVGLGVLVEAVAIGKEKKDLTNFVVEPVKKKQMISEPACKSWSSLGPGDILTFLTDGSRLSKTKSNELFWEAVWPRLLAKGWHSELPKNQGYVTSKDYLVFLIPGVKKFSRRKLVKGNHYFDSVSDVLSKVVGEPDLLQLEEEAKVGSCNEEEPEKGSTKDEESFDHPQCYLKPQVSTCNKDHMKFVVVDTSLVHGGKSSDLRELKPLPVNSMGKVEIDAAAGIKYEGKKRVRIVNNKKDMSNSIEQKSTKFPVVDTNILSGGKLLKVRQLRYPPAGLEDASKMTGLLRESKGSSSNDYSPSALTYGEKNIDKTDSCKSISDSDATNKKEAYGGKPDNDANNMVESQKNQKTLELDNSRLKRTIKHQFNHRVRTKGDSNHAAMPTKRRRLTACAKADENRIIEKSSGDLESTKSALSQFSSFPDARKNVGDRVRHQKNGSSVASSANRSVKESNDKSMLNDNCQCMSISCITVEKCKSLSPATLNTPQVPSKSENGKMLAMVEKEDSKLQKENDPYLASDTQEGVEEPLGTPCDNGSLKEQPDINPRRQSTRNRPLTVRALESLANEFLHVQRRQKRKDVQTHKEPFGHCRKARTKGKTMLHCHQQTAVFVHEEKPLNKDSSVS